MRAGINKNGNLKQKLKSLHGVKKIKLTDGGILKMVFEGKAKDHHGRKMSITKRPDQDHLVMS